MIRNEIINIIGRSYLTTNIENDEFSYQKAFGKVHKDFASAKIDSYKDVDIRFEDKKSRVVILVETKQDFSRNFKKAKEQLSAYMFYEKILTGHKIIGILANTNDNRIRVWKDCISDDTLLENFQSLTSFEDFRNFISPQSVNNKEQVIKSTYKLNETLHGLGVPEFLRSQLVGTCILALKNNLKYQGVSTAQIISGIYDILGTLLRNDANRADKISILNNKVLNDQRVRRLPADDFISLLDDIRNDIMPYINEYTTQGQDLLNLFFTTFNKYVGKEDKNQAFTPDHIVSFMCDVIGINRKSRVLDPCCGSGAFLVRALTNALNDCQTTEELEEVKKHHIYGIEAEEKAFGLSTTNMLIHGDGNSNVRMESCFRMEDWIKEAHIDRILMNPPYNAKRGDCNIDYVNTWRKDCKEDPSKGLHYLYYIAETVGTGKLAILLPMQCAIGNTGDIRKFKELMMQHHRLDAVFSLPNEMFYPGASVVACCMIWELGVRHTTANTPTFFGYFKEDGFAKRKYLGRIERVNPETGDGVWSDIHNKWLSLYKTRSAEVGLSAIHAVTFEDEWCAEAYLETDYAKLTNDNFVYKLRDYVTHLIGKSNPYVNIVFSTKPFTQDSIIELNTSAWQWFVVSSIFDVSPGRYHYANEYEDGFTPYLSATAINNGIGKYISLEPDFKGGAISTEKVQCTAFYHPDPFCATSDVNILYRKDGVEINTYVGLFLATIIDFNENFRWTYGRQCRKNDTEQIRLKLPAIFNDDGSYSPNWQFMEDYIKTLPYSKSI